MTKANVAFVINKNYIGQFKVTFYSLVTSNKDLEISVHLLQSDLSDSDKEDIKKFVNSLNAEIAFYQIDDGFFDGLPKMGYDNSFTAYYKVLLPYCLDFLPSVLYLDCDIIVRGSLKPLFENQTGKFLACAEDYKINKKRREHVKKIVGSEDINYFNSGVIKFDFSDKSAIVSKEEVFEYITSHKDDIRWHDQDILNHFYAKNCKFIDEKYNYTATYKSILDIFVRKGKKKTVIVHYANWKPWKSNYIGKYYKLYKKTYDALAGEYGVNFLQKRKLKEQIRLIFKYLLGR